MKIIFTTDTIHRGGKERQIFIITQQLLKKAYDVSIISLKYAEQNYLDEYEIDSERIIIIKSNSRKQIYREIKNVFLTLHPDIIISWDSKTAFFSLLISKKYGFRFINASIRHGIRLFKKGYFIRTLICHLSPNVMANSLAGLKANNLRPGKNRFVLYNGIENKFSVTYLSEEKKVKRKELLGKEFNGIKIFVSVGNLVPFKDYFTVLEALKKFKKQQKFHYIIIGEGPLRAEYEKLIEEYGLREYVTLTGRIENVSEYLAISNYLIHSSRGEGISNAILEGMYAGLPIIATIVGGIPETVFPMSSILFPYKDDKTLLKCLLKAPNLFAGFDPSSKEYNKHLAKFSVEQMVKRFEDIIMQVVNNKD